MNALWILTVALVGVGAEPPVDFDTEILPILTRAGCNTGECHGAAIGRGGFKLSLFGSEPGADHQAIVHELEGRRVNLARPDESLLILKPTESLSHEGGARLAPQGDGVERLLAWIESGAPRLQSRRLRTFEVDPAEMVVTLDESIQLRATATFDDGTKRDVTRWTVFTPADPSAVDWDADRARVRLLRRGDATFTARYLDRVAALRLLAPLADEPVDHSSALRANFIDDEILATLQTLRIPLSPPADDAAFLRRVSLDLMGRLPQPEAIQRFLDDRNPDKRRRLVDDLLNSTEFVDYWTYQLARVFRVGGARPEREAATAFRQWLQAQVAEGAGYDALVETMLTAEGDSHTVGPANFYRVVGDPRMQAEYVGQALLGVRLGCANCHDHPLDRWTQDDYHGLAALFAGVERGRIVKAGRRGEVTNPRTGESAVPRLPGSDFLTGEAAGDGRRALADWLLDRENPYFAQAIVNRLWRAMMGRGLVEPADDLSATNPASHPRLLERLASDFLEHGCDLRHTLRLIANSAAYARSSTQIAGNAADDRFYSRYLARPLEPEVLADAIADVTGVAERYDRHPPGTRAINLVEADIPSQSLDALGRCGRDQTCEAAGARGGGLAARLHLLNGPLLNEKIASDEGRLRGLILAGKSAAEIVDAFYLLALGRPPARDERDFWIAQLGGADERERLEDFVWSLLSCREFVTNH